MGVKDQIHATDAYQQRQAEQQVQQATTTGGNTQPTNFGPVLSWEKTDVAFWLQVVQVVLLYLILKELQRGGG